MSQQFDKAHNGEPALGTNRVGKAPTVTGPQYSGGALPNIDLGPLGCLPNIGGAPAYFPLDKQGVTREQ